MVFDKIDSFLVRRSYAMIVAICLLLTALIARVEILFGYEVSVAAFFLIPIAISAWYAGRMTGIAFCILSAAIWLTIDVPVFQHHYENPYAPYWNAAVRLGFFLVAEELLSYLKMHLEIEKRQARTDDLTGLLNVRGFTEQAEKIFGVSARHNRNITLACLDVDDFGKMHERFGRKECDELLRVVGRKIAASLRASDIAGRMGEDEFAILLPETDESGAKSMFENFRIALSREMEKHGWPVGFSLGVVSCNSPRANLEDAVKIADSLLYQSKADGMHEVRFANCPGNYAGLPR